MERVPDDVLMLIFEWYQSSADILTVSRRWHALLLSSSLLWSQISIHITSYTTIPYITRRINGDKGGGQIQQQPSLLTAYLERSFLDIGVGLPLDVLIKWHEIDEETWEIGSDDEYEDEDMAMHRCEVQTQSLFRCIASQQYIIRPEHSMDPKNPKSSPLERIRSLVIDMSKVSLDCDCEGRPNIHLDEIAGVTSMNMLQELKLINSDFSLGCISVPSLTRLDLNETDIFPISDFTSLNHLSLIDCDHEEGLDSHWEEFKNLQSIQLTGTEPFEIPATHTFPQLTFISMEWCCYEMAMWAKLGNIFNQDRPLATLVLEERSLESVVELFDSAPNFAVKTLRLSSRCLLSRPIAIIWGRDEFGTETWKNSEKEILAASNIEYEMGKKGTEVVAMDAHMKALLEEGHRYSRAVRLLGALEFPSFN